MNRKFLLKPLLLVFSLSALCSCGQSEALSFLNSNFETGDFTGWTLLTGSGFAVTSTASFTQAEGSYCLASGATATGSLVSSKFTLASNGRVGLLLGEGEDHINCSVALLSYVNDEILISSAFYGTGKSGEFSRAILYCPKASGNEVYLKITDASTSARVLLDDVINGDEGSGQLLDENSIATAYESDAVSLLNTRYRHAYHAQPKVGWCNDPNGFSFYGGKAHLFFQHYPYASHWGSMHWGHVSSLDLMKWEDQGIALSPEETYDYQGCFSGSALAANSKLYLMYTSVTPGYQEQSLAYSTDGITFSKSAANPIISHSDLPYGISEADFRDPCLYEENGTYYALMGARDILNAKGCLLLYCASDPEGPWTYLGQPISSAITPGVFECPDYETLGDDGVLVTSPQQIRSSDKATYQNDHSSTYQIGTIDPKTGLFVNTQGDLAMEEFDKGFDFYAAQLTKHGDTLLLTAWMNQWGRSYPTQADGWCGSMVLPREITLKNGHLYQQPIKASRSYRKNGMTLASQSVDGRVHLDGFDGMVKELNFSLNVSSLASSGKAGVHLLTSANEHTDIYYDKSLGMVVFDRRNNGTPITSDNDPGTQDVRYCRVDPENGLITFQIFIDRSSIEVFLNGGYYTMTGLVYPRLGGDTNSLYSEGGSALFSTISAYDLVIE